MNTLRLENINLHAPYRVMQDPERHNNFYFVSDSGARFDIDFAENDSIIPSGAFRNRLFVRWFNLYEHRDKFIIETAEGKMDGQMNFLAIISRKDNPMLSIVLEEFNETISFLFDPQEI